MLDEPSAVLLVDKMIESLHRSDLDGFLAALANEIVIVDDVPPFRSTGMAEAETWAKVVMGAGKRLNAYLRMGAPKRFHVEDHKAYVVAQAFLGITTAGGSAADRGLLTLTLREVENTWLIDTIVWSEPN